MGNSVGVALGTLKLAEVEKTMKFVLILTSSLIV